MSERIGFIGLGTMGTPMVTNLLKGGFTVTIRDIDPARVHTLVELGAREARTPKQVAAESTVTISMVFDDAVVKEVALAADGILEGLQRDSVYIDMSTISPVTSSLVSREIEKKGASFMSAPVTLGPRAAREGKLTIMVGGRKDTFERCLPVLKAMGEKIYHVGERPDMGHVFKLVNNFLSATHGAIAAEAMAFGVKAGADPEALFRVITHGSGNSHMFQLRVGNMLKGNKDVITLPIEGLFKDLEAVTAYAKHISMPLLFPVIAQQIHLDGMAAGLGKKDPSAFSELYERRYGIRIAKD